MGETRSLLELQFDEQPDPDEFVQAAMRWHFNPETGSPFWLGRAASLGFDPRADVKCFGDLSLFPNVANELRNVRAEDLVPKGYGPHPPIVRVGESGGTTGPPKRVVVLRDWWDTSLAWAVANMDVHGFPRNRNWLAFEPSGPHLAGQQFTEQATALGGLTFAIDMDPRWVKKLIADGRADEAEEYAEHLIDQAAVVLESQDVGVVISTPPVLARLVRRSDLVEKVRRQVVAIHWGGAHMDADTRHLYNTEVFPGIKLYGTYGSTMVLGEGACERVGPSDEDLCIYDTFSPYVTFSVVDPATGSPVPYGERGQVVMNHVSKSFLLPNNLERDTATRVRAPKDRVGDSVADVTPVQRFDDEDVIEGVY